MSSNLGTNFSYRAHKFLDDRQGAAITKQDLLEWDIPVPEGFEICVGDKWYYYKSSINLEDTGHWIPRLSNGLEGIVDESQSASVGFVRDLEEKVDSVKEEVGDMGKNLSPYSLTEVKATAAYKDLSDTELEKVVNNKISQGLSATMTGEYIESLDYDRNGLINTADLSGFAAVLSGLMKTKAAGQYNNVGGSKTVNLEIGSTVIPQITCKVVRPNLTWIPENGNVKWVMLDMDKYIIPESAKVEGYVADSININKTSGLITWNSAFDLTSTTAKTYSLDLKVAVNRTVEISDRVYYKFLYKTYYTSAGIDLWNESRINRSMSGVFVESGSLGEVKFDCTGGKYPYIFIPTKLYNANLKTYVNNNLNSDFEIKDVLVVNSMGIELEYKMLRSGYIQTGNNIGIKIQ